MKNFLKALGSFGAALLFVVSAVLLSAWLTLARQTECYVVTKTWESALNNSTSQVWQETRQKVNCND